MQPTVFADTFYWLALSRPRDPWHVAAVPTSDLVKKGRGLARMTRIVRGDEGDDERAGDGWREQGDRDAKIPNCKILDFNLGQGQGIRDRRPCGRATWQFCHLSSNWMKLQLAAAHSE